MMTTSVTDTSKRHLSLTQCAGEAHGCGAESCRSAKPVAQRKTDVKEKTHIQNQSLSIWVPSSVLAARIRTQACTHMDTSNQTMSVYDWTLVISPQNCVMFTNHLSASQKKRRATKYSLNDAIDKSFLLQLRILPWTFTLCGDFKNVGYFHTFHITKKSFLRTIYWM